jgi:hypothetical protein
MVTELLSFTHRTLWACKMSLQLYVTIWTTALIGQETIQVYLQQNRAQTSAFCGERVSCIRHLMTTFLTEDSDFRLILRDIHMIVLVYSYKNYVSGLGARARESRGLPYLYSGSNIRVEPLRCERGLLYLSPYGCRVWCSLEVLKPTPANSDERCMLNVICFRKPGWRS